MFELGRTYTRNEIHEQVGGGIQAYLPTKGGSVVCACLTPDDNPDAPGVVLVGDGPVIVATAEQFVTAGNAVPTFLKRSVNAWEYVGMYRATGISHDADEIARRAEAASRDDVVMILYLESVDQH